VLSGPPVSAPCHAVPLARTSARTPAAATGPRRRPAPPISLAVLCCAHRRPPLFVARARRYQSSPEPPRPCRSTSLNPRPLLRFSPPRGAEPRSPPLPCLPCLRFKRRRPPCTCSLLFFPRSPPPTTMWVIHAPLLFPPLVHAGDRVAVVLIAFRPRPLPFLPPPTVRPAYLPPLPYLGPPSPLSSSSVAPGASRSHR
jgi:hypothetical protein